ncbi:MAG: bifunctional phosphopantothenoylcysteine decarboxylase/phosphopantothenate--cysteine ligase CoaBC, partial [Gemmatimonadales bacterium]
IAAYKCVQLARDLTLLGAGVDVVLTRSARRFVGPTSFEGVTGRPVRTSLWKVDSAAEHIRLGSGAHVAIVAPATADLMARLAAGRADDLLTTTLLVTEAPVLVAPAMNDRMWADLRTRRNAGVLADLPGWRLVGPGTGALAVGEGRGAGRMVEPERLLLESGRALAGNTDPLSGRTVLVTTGGTREALDTVRFVGNRSTGQMGLEIALEAWLRGALVTVVQGPGGAVAPDLPEDSFRVVRVESAREMLEATLPEVPSADLQVYAAAVSDYRPEEAAATKRKRSDTGERWSVELVENPDIALRSREHSGPGSIRVGFALETEDLVESARDKRSRKGFDLVVANPAGRTDAGFESGTNRGFLVGADDVTELPPDSKAAMAGRVLDAAGALLARGPRSGEPT